ncbi:sulfatase-like hydrolase/transferase [Verrucomicrobiaceae bacterium N1E253]|uniref:Sulfatase-like hydrolase/transferase n=1 Tax=Oceaniferula marina TaxID=2748318 RepID=A0A851GNZ8_9BACT|nr:sulfatase-like hydrolase/transferase [Oceaniferula marina]NWK55864.1 sulfatase-like hydrolase/transferase [Oceaniferula marina]
MIKHILSCALVASFSTTNLLAAPSEKPNIILILADDLGNGDLGYNGCKDIRTPQLDLLASQSLILTDTHTTASVCAPSRAGLMSGTYQQRHGFECNGPHGKDGLPGSVVTYAEAMKDAGYETMGLGKWHLGYQPDMHPNAQGFDHFSGFLAGGRSYWSQKKTNNSSMLQRNGTQVPEEKIGYLTDWLTDEAMRLIKKRNTEKPFFMYLSYNAPHTPMHAKEEDLKKYESIEKKNRRTYAAMVDNMDANIGRLLIFLDDQKLRENSIIIFTSDNGGATTNASDNGIYRGMKGSKWEGGHRVPCLISWPKAGIHGGHRVPLLSSTVDFMATSLDAAGEAPQIDKLKLDGVSLLPALRQGPAAKPTAARNALYFRRSAAAAIRENQWQLIRVTEEDNSHRYLLFDLSKDIGQTVDLSQEQPERLQKLATKLQTWEQDMQEPKWLEGKMWEKNQRLKHKMDVIGRDAERRLP